MKIPTNNLFDLIQSMSASEKRYFKRHYSSEKNLTTDLFDCINGMDVYEEAEVKSQFKNTKLSKNLKVYKVQLTELLLKSLVSYYAKKTVKSKIRQGLEEIDILLEKQLYNVALTRCGKLKNLAIKSQEFEYLIPVLECEIKLNNFFSGHPEQGIHDNVLQVIDTSEDIIQLYKLKEINFNLSNQNNKSGSNKIKVSTEKEAKALLDSKLKIVDKTTESFHNQFYKNSSSAILYKMILKDPEKEFQFKKENVALFESHPHLINNNGSIYFAALYNYLVACRSQKKYKELESGIIKINKLVKDLPALGRNAIYIQYLEVKHLYGNQKFSEIRERLEPLVIEHIKKYKQENEQLAILCFIYFSLSNLILKDYHQVHYYLRRLFDKSKILNNHYLRLFDIIELLSHLETNDNDVADNLISTLKRRTRTQKDPSSFYSFILNSIREKLRNPAEQQQKLNDEFVNQWEEFKSDEFHQLASEFFLDDWKNALTKNLSISDYIGQKK